MKHILTIAFCAFFALIPAAMAVQLVIINNNNGNETVFRLISVSPFENEKLKTSPDKVTLTFSMGVRPDKSKLEVTNIYGAVVNDPELLSTGDTLSVEIPQALPPGRYRVKWKARCRCDGEVEMSQIYRFTVE